MSVSKHVVNIYFMQSLNQNLPLSKEEGIWKRKIGVYISYKCSSSELCICKSTFNLVTLQKSHL
jgi:hypothetical protein